VSWGFRFSSHFFVHLALASPSTIGFTPGCQ